MLLSIWRSHAGAHRRSWDIRLSADRSFCTCSAQMSYTGDAASTCPASPHDLSACPVQAKWPSPPAL